jgi:ankyrin repeat protein
MIAILHSSSEVVDYLINECNADINYLKENGDNLFHILSDRGANRDIYDIFNILISKNIDINHINNDGHTPLSVITYYRWRNNDILIQLYLQNGANPNILIQEDEGWTHLMKIIKECKLDMFKLWIKYGADLSHRDKFGTTPRILILTLIEQSNCDGDKSIWGEMLQIIDDNLSS